MNKGELVSFITQQYSAEADYPWIKYPNHAVFRHQDTRKWFALVIELPKCKLALPGEGSVDVVNLKCDPILIGSLRGEKGVYPAYHMNKSCWVTVALDGSVEDEKIKGLLNLSYELTDKKPR